MATGWQQTPCWLEVQNLYFSGTSVCTTSDTLLNTSITSDLVSLTIGSIAILSLFCTHSKVSIVLSSLRTSESVESLNVRINLWTSSTCCIWDFYRWEQRQEVVSGEDVPAALCCFQTSFRWPAYRTPHSLYQQPGLQLFYIALNPLGRILWLDFLRLTFFLRLTVRILSFLRLTAKFLAVLRLTVNPIETLFVAWRCDGA